MVWWRTRDSCVKMEFLLAKPRSFSNLPAFSDLNGRFLRLCKVPVSGSLKLYIFINFNLPSDVTWWSCWRKRWEWHLSLNGSRRVISRSFGAQVFAHHVIFLPKNFFKNYIKNLDKNRELEVKILKKVLVYVPVKLFHAGFWAL